MDQTQILTDIPKLYNLSSLNAYQNLMKNNPVWVDIARHLRSQSCHVKTDFPLPHPSFIHQLLSKWIVISFSAACLTDRCFEKKPISQTKKVDSLTWNVSHTTQERSGKAKCFIFFTFLSISNLFSEENQGFGICGMLPFITNQTSNNLSKHFFTGFGQTEIWAFSFWSFSPQPTKQSFWKVALHGVGTYRDHISCDFNFSGMLFRLFGGFFCAVFSAMKPYFQRSFSGIS